MAAPDLALQFDSQVRAGALRHPGSQGEHQRFDVGEYDPGPGRDFKDRGQRLAVSEIHGETIAYCAIT